MSRNFKNQDNSIEALNYKTNEIKLLINYFIISELNCQLLSKIKLPNETTYRKFNSHLKINASLFVKLTPIS